MYQINWTWRKFRYYMWPITKWVPLQQIRKSSKQYTISYHWNNSRDINYYKELGLEFLKSSKWFRRPCTFYKIKTYKIPPYLAQLLPKGTHSHNTRNSEDITTFQSTTETFKFSFFPSSIVQSNKLDLKGRNYLVLFILYLGTI